MNDRILNNIVNDFIEEFQIPPYFPKKSLINYALEGEAQLLNRKSPISFETDRVAVSLLKSYLYYAYFKQTDKFFVNYNGDIINWQMSN